MSDFEKIENILVEKGLFVGTTSGVSMYPMLRNRKDTIIIERFSGRLKKYDVPLYKRGKKYVLHRIIDVKPEYYVILGDNCVEKEYVKEEQILGGLTGFYRGEKPVDMNGWRYKVYVRIWCFLFPLRYIYKKGKSIVKKIVKGIYHA